MTNIFFDSWESIIRTCIISALAYISLIIMLRISGKRTLSKMNAFDFVVTVALGSILATVMLNKDLALADGVLAFFLLILFQYIITYLSVRYEPISKLVKSTPALIAYKGELLKPSMIKERINEDEVNATIRKHGLSSLAEIEAIVLESDGSLSVIQIIKDPSAAPISSIQRLPDN